MDDKGILHCLDFTDYRSFSINKIKPFNIIDITTYRNISWNLIKKLIILIIGLIIFYYLIMTFFFSNNEESLSDNDHCSDETLEIVENNIDYSKNDEHYNNKIEKLADDIIQNIKYYIEKSYNFNSYQINFNNDRKFKELLEKANEIFKTNKINKLLNIDIMIKEINENKKKENFQNFFCMSKEINIENKEDNISVISSSTLQSEREELCSFFL